MGLGDALERALKKVGITEERVSNWLGRPCGCRKRKQRLNQLGQWAARVLTGKISSEEAHERISEISEGDVKPEEAKDKDGQQPPQEKV